VEDDDSKRQTFDPLLERQVSVDGNKYIELSRSAREQRAVLDTSPAEIPNC
jgi:hypothetical protein